jgi:hypothetical protein
MDSDRKTSAPYGPFSTFDTALDKLGSMPTLPPRIDHTVFTSFAGAAKSHVIGTFRFFDLIDEAGAPTQALKDLTKNKEGRKAAVRQLIKDHYPNISENDLAGSSPAQLDARLGDKTYNISGDTRQKARSFLIKAAEFAELPISPLLKQRGSRGPRPRRARNAAVRQNNAGGGQAQNNGRTADENPPPNPTATPITLAPGRIVYLQLPADWKAENDAKKLLSILALTFDVNVQVS